MILFDDLLAFVDISDAPLRAGNILWFILGPYHYFLMVFQPS